MMVYPLLAIPTMLYIGFGDPPHDLMLPLLVLGPMLISGGHFGILSICGVFYPSVIRANGAAGPPQSPRSARWSAR
ncbi:MAG: hypothetical protein WDN45_03990 [Caulobacteraceae bacterium]